MVKQDTKHKWQILMTHVTAQLQVINTGAGASGVKRLIKLTTRQRKNITARKWLTPTIQNMGLLQVMAMGAGAIGAERLTTSITCNTGTGEIMDYYEYHNEPPRPSLRHCKDCGYWEKAITDNGKEYPIGYCTWQQDFREPDDTNIEWECY